jgi:hypothetical protein
MGFIEKQNLSLNKYKEEKQYKLKDDKPKRKDYFNREWMRDI